MAQAKKFGTFGGVFTPSILTILGVIMYLRLGYVVGEAGFYAVLALIIIAHIISVSTGLSLSSIATDKKIKTGGVYYMLSRSLGLAMGGSIGITLFLGTALSIALYIVGFVENFLSIEVINQFLGMDGSINDIRLIGTIVIILLVIIAYTSTSIAIKTQFFILAAIALSLISIVVGLFVNTEYLASAPAISPTADSPDLIVLFAIFFPAVTGFTAGVAMSGDLKSPKDSIPKGTLLSIVVGFVVYIALATVFAFFVNRDLLLTDTNFLQKIAWFSPFVIAGIWGATLSSALGGILGAPRIFQAMSIDKVTPGFFAVGVGKANEPRRALILTFLLAEIGILIGELDAIARLVSMFYIAAYGFINLAYVLERWSNSDFRPTLKISIWVGIIGFAASIFVMMNLDAIGMLAAFVIMFGIYLFLKRKEVHGNMNDVWQSVWTSVIRTSLNRINKKPLSETNWQPNIILFSGGTNARSHLMEFGLSIAGKQGFLSNFDLVLSENSELLFSKTKQKIATEIEEQYTGVFTRRQSVSDIYEGIEMISQTYGFSGVVPNTIMLGWARQTEKPLRFSQMVARLLKLDMNVVLLDFDKRVGWGKKQSIDIWWRGGGHNGNLALTLSKFITLDNEWAQAKIRLIIVNPQNDLSTSIYEGAKNVLDNLRIDAEIMIINNEIEKRSFYDIIQLESVNTDLTFLGFSPLIEGKEEIFVEKTNLLCENIGTVAIIQASSEFKNLSLGKTQAKITKDEVIDFSGESSTSFSTALDELKLEESRTFMESLIPDLEGFYQYLSTHIFKSIYEVEQKWLEQLKLASEKSFDNLISRLANNQASTFIKSIDAQHRIFIRGQIQFAKDNWVNSLDQVFEEESEPLMAQLSQLIKTFSSAPYRMKTRLNKEKIEQYEFTSKRMRRKAAWLKTLISLFKEIPYYVHLKELLQMYFPQNIYSAVHLFINQSAFEQFKFENQVFKTFDKISNVFDNSLELSKDSLPSEEDLIEQKKLVSAFIDHLIKERKENYIIANEKLKNTFVAELRNFVSILNHPLCNSTLDYNQDYSVAQRKTRKQLLKSIDSWRDHQTLIENLNELNLRLLAFRFSTQNSIADLKNKLTALIDDHITKYLKELVSILEKANEKEGEEQKEFIENRLKDLNPQLDLKLQQGFIDHLNYSIKKIKSNINEFPETVGIISESFQDSNMGFDLQQHEEIEVAVKRTLDYMIEKEMMDVREILISSGQELNAINNSLSEIHQSLVFPITKDNAVEKGINQLVDNRLDFVERLEIITDKTNSIYTQVLDKKELLSGILLKKSAGFKANLELYPFIRNIEKLKNYIKTESTKQWFSSILKIKNDIHYSVSNQLNKLWYNQSSGLLLAQKLSKSILDKETRVETLLSLKEEVSPKDSVLKKLPDYYQQLFLRKQFYLNEFWVGREEEIREFNKAHEQWNAGFAGGIIILGERNSGKSFFANYMVQQMDIKGEVYFINPPYTGSIEVNELLRNIQNVTENNGSLARIMNEIPAKSVFIFDDLELWWEKSPMGMRVIQEIISMINRFGDQHLFVLMSNVHSFRLINKYQKIESTFLSLIELRPFNARQLKEIVTKRHSSSSLQFTINNIPGTRYRSWNYARLFSRYFTYSEGNPGVALQAWIKSIDSISQSVINLIRPKVPDTAPLLYLDTDWMIFILQFLLHKRMNLSKLVRVTQESRAHVIKKIRILKRAGVVIEIGDDILDINPYLIPFLRKALIKRELL